MASAIEARTYWQDSGYDCDHCGGRILVRTDTETGQPDRQCYQCEQCSCQWTLDRRPLRVGKRPECKSAQRERLEDDQSRPSLDPSRLLLFGLLALAALLLFRFGGGALLRWVLPALVIGAGLYLVLRFVRRDEQ